MLLRTVMDYGLLSWVAARRFSSSGLILANGALLGAAAYCAGRWTFTEPRWWISAALLGAASASLGLYALPSEMRSRVVGLVIRRSVA
jgi:hypothetical protein